MSQLHQHYRLLLGLDEAWRVESVQLAVDEKRIDIFLEHDGKRVSCPECGESCSIADHAPERQWRHLDTMQFETRLHARVPRCRCRKCGVKTVSVPWADRYSRFTLMFEAVAIEVMKACSSISRAADLLRLDWNGANAIMERAVERGLMRRSVDEVRQVGIDEKSFGRGQDYVSLMTDIDGSRVLEVTPGRTEESADQLWRALPSRQRVSVEAVALDMWQPFMKSTARHAPQAAIVHDKFHISKHLNEAVDKVRRAEHRDLSRQGESPLTGTRQMWLFGEERLPERYAPRFEEIKRKQLKTSRAWAIKESFQVFWTYAYAGTARRYFSEWYGWASRSRLQPIVKSARMIKSHLANILTYFRHPITNAKSEAFNSRIQWLKSAARGFRSFANYRIRILFHCGRLDMKPDGCH